MRVARALSRSAIACVVSGLIAAPAAFAAPPGLVGAYGFDEGGSGTAVVDSSGAGNGGTISGATRTASGKFGAALSFDGVNDMVTVADSNSLDLSPAMTLEAWVNPNGGGWRTAVVKERPGGLAWGMYTSTDTNRPSVEIATAAGAELRGPSAVASNVWSHVAATYDGASLKMFVNGTQVASKAATGSLNISSGALRIGGNAIWSEYFKGLIDEVRVYNRALTPTELLTDMNTPVGGAPLPDTTPPSAPGGVTASKNGLDVTVGWTPSTDDVGVTGYRVYRSTTTGFTPSEANRITTAAGTATSYKDTVSQTQTFFYYRVIAVDAAGNASAASAEASIAIPGGQPPLVTNISDTTVGGTIELTWDQPAHTAPMGRYEIHRSTTSSFLPSAANRIGTTTTRSFTDTTPPATGPIYYRIVGYDIYGAVSGSGATYTTALGPDTTPPTATIFGTMMRGCPAGTIQNEYIDIDGVVNDDRDGATAEIWFDGVKKAGPTVGGVRWQLSTYLYANGPHVINVIGRDRVGNEGRFDCTVNLYTPAGAIDILSPADGAAVAGVLPINVERRRDGAVSTYGYWQLYVDGVAKGAGVQGTTSSLDTRTLTNGLHTLRVDFLSGFTLDFVHATDSIQVDVQNGVIATPAGLAAEEYSTGVKVRWDAALGAAKYRVYRGTAADFTPSGGNLVTETTSLSVTQLQVTPGTYFYKVIGLDDGSAQSAAASLEFDHTEDVTAPTVTLAASCGAEPLSDYVGPIAGTVNDERGGDVRLEVKVDDTRIYGVAVLTGAYQFNWDTRAFADGPHVVKVVATDLWGNVKVLECGWTVDNKELSIPIDVAASPLSGTVSVGFQPKADGAGVVRAAQLYIDGVKVADTPLGPYTYNWDTTTAGNGTHTLEARMWWPGYTSPQATSTKTVTVTNTGPSGLMAAYGFEEASGATVTDTSPSGFTGTISGATRSTAGKFGRALSFDGVNDLVTVPDANALDLTTGMTLSAWVQPSQLGDWRTVVFKSRPGGMAYGLYGNTDANRPAGLIFTGAEQEARGTSALALNAWSHLAVTYDSIAVKLYVNGTLVATQPATAPITVSTGALTIGGNTTWSEWFKGLIDEVRVYNRALSAAEVVTDRDRAVVPGT